MSTCNRLDLQTLGSQPIMPKNLTDHWLQMNRLKFKTVEKLPITLEESTLEYTRINKGKPEDVNM
jgi:hypothetical protein